MKIRLLTVSHKQPAWVLDGCADYEKRLPREWRFEVVELKPAARTQGMPPEKVQAAEAERLNSALPKGGLCVALDERGEAWPTRTFAGPASADHGNWASSVQPPFRGASTTLAPAMAAEPAVARAGLPGPPG